MAGDHLRRPGPQGVLPVPAGDPHQPRRDQPQADRRGRAAAGGQPGQRLLAGRGGRRPHRGPGGPDDPRGPGRRAVPDPAAPRSRRLRAAPRPGPGPLAARHAPVPRPAVLHPAARRRAGRLMAVRPSTERPSTERLREFFAPQSIAIVGASDTSGWARFVALSSTAIGFTGPLLPVHPRHATALGRPAVPSLRDLAEPADLAFIMAPTHAVESVLQDAGAAGVRNAVVLASGFREAGPEGRALEDRLVACARDQGVTLLGPNCLGFLNAHARTAPFALTIP